ncbi:ABATE domain-containing protein [Streptomyces sp. NPDC002994]|uniref:CGNR zinc finger domain-containing protein n=1 Tax=Streptomyces sp. NPDC002994 TaxID=3154441 RepID=UPI0033BE2B07
MSDTGPLTGEPLALDLVNTRPRGADLLGTPAQLRAWIDLQGDRLAELQCAATETGQVDLAAVRAVCAVREHTATAIRGHLLGQPPPAAALRALNDAQGAAPAVRELGWQDGAFTAASRRTGPLAVRLAAVLAEAATDLLAGPAIDRVRACEAEDCVLLFLPAHPRRRWCSPTRCGNRARVARYYQRHKPA